MDWLIDHGAIWFLPIPALGLVFLAWRFAGFRAALIAAAGVALVMLTGGAYRAGRKSGDADAKAKQHKANEKAVKDYDAIKNKTGGMSDDDLDAANAPFVRKHGGKR